MKKVTLLGATGTIGANTLDVLERHPDQYRVYAVSAFDNVERMSEICRRCQPEIAVMADEDAAQRLDEQLRRAGQEVQVWGGRKALEDIAAAADADIVVAAIVGGAGLLPALAAARQGKTILLANKEALVMSGAIFMDAVNRHQATLIPLDSEHNALFQCLPIQPFEKLSDIGVLRLHLTASGGPFLRLPLDELPKVTAEQACRHPNWVMGRKISVDSATMMNKGLEVIEASWLFRAAAEEITVLIHPESIIHSMVEYTDGSFLAQLGSPDMRTPIACALAWPQRIASGVEPLNLVALNQLHFEAMDYNRFPCLALAEQALRRGGTSSAVLNAANEQTVAAFLEGDVTFDAIPKYIEAVLEQVSPVDATRLETVLEHDQLARNMANEMIQRKLH